MCCAAVVTSAAGALVGLAAFHAGNLRHGRRALAVYLAAAGLVAHAAGAMAGVMGITRMFVS